MNGSLVPGQRLGRYELLSPTGQGGMATVWLARLVGTRGFHKPVAVKIMLPSIREDPDAEKMFQTEAALASRIHHPNVVEILDLGEEDETLYLVMEWLHGEPLSQVLSKAAKRNGMPLGVAVRIGAQVCAGLHAAHELTDEAGKLLGVVHRDVSPQNVIVGFNGTVKLVDFGIAKVTAEATHLTDMGMVRGKVAYMAPEQIKLERLDRRTDVFAAGILLYVMTTGRHPFKRDERSDTALAICEDAPACPPTRLMASYPERLERVLLRALAKKPSERYSTAQEFGEDLLRSMPPSRGSVQEELQKYMAELMPERLAHHQELIRRALGVHGTSGVPVGALAKSAHSSSTLRAVSVSDSTSNVPIAEASSAADGSAPPNSPLPTTRRRRRASSTLLSVAAAAVVGAVTIAAVTGTRHRFGVHAPAAAAQRSESGHRNAPRPSAVEDVAPLPVATPAAETVAPSPSASSVVAPSTPPSVTVKAAPKRAVRLGSRRAAARDPAVPTQGTVLKDPYAQ